MSDAPRPQSCNRWVRPKWMWPFELLGPLFFLSLYHLTNMFLMSCSLHLCNWVVRTLEKLQIGDIMKSFSRILGRLLERSTMLLSSCGSANQPRNGRNPGALLRCFINLRIDHPTSRRKWWFNSSTTQREDGELTSLTKILKLPLNCLSPVLLHVSLRYAGRRTQTIDRWMWVWELKSELVGHASKDVYLWNYSLDKYGSVWLYEINWYQWYQFHCYYLIHNSDCNLTFSPEDQKNNHPNLYVQIFHQHCSNQKNSKHVHEKFAWVSQTDVCV